MKIIVVCVLCIMSVCVCVCVCGCVGVWVCVCVCVCVSSCIGTSLVNNGSIHLKLEHLVVYENSSEEFDIGHCLIKVKVILLLGNVSPFNAIQIVKSCISVLAHGRKLLLSTCVHQIKIFNLLKCHHA